MNLRDFIKLLKEHVVQGIVTTSLDTGNIVVQFQLKDNYDVHIVIEDTLHE